MASHAATVPATATAVDRTAEDGARPSTPGRPGAGPRRPRPGRPPGPPPPVRPRVRDIAVADIETEHRCPAKDPPAQLRNPGGPRTRTCAPSPRAASGPAVGSGARRGAARH